MHCVTDIPLPYCETKRYLLRGLSMIATGTLPMSVKRWGSFAPGSIGKKAREEAASKRRPLARAFELLFDTINSKRAELRVFFANLAKLDIFWIGAPSPDFLHAVPDLNDHALRRVPI